MAERWKIVPAVADSQPNPLPAIRADHLDVLQCAMLTDVADDMKLVRHMMLNLKDSADMAENTYAEDVRAGVRRLRLELDALDALGWQEIIDRGPEQGGES